MRASLLEVPPQLLEHLGLEGCYQLIPDHLFGPLTDVRELRRHHDPKRPDRQGTQKHGVA
jgi:hypothetical protein